MTAEDIHRIVAIYLRTPKLEKDGRIRKPEDIDNDILKQFNQTT